MKMSQGKSKAMPMQIFWGVEAVYYGIVQVVKFTKINYRKKNKLPATPTTTKPHGLKALQFYTANT